MNFKQATDALMESVTMEDLAKEMGVSVQALRQARAAENSTARRSPPAGWEVGVKKLAEVRATRLKKLASAMH